MPNSFVSFPAAQWYFVRFACSLNCCEKRGSLSKFNCYVKLKHISRAVPSPAPSLLPSFLRRILSRDKVAKSTQCLNKQQSLSLFRALNFCVSFVSAVRRSGKQFFRSGTIFSVDICSKVHVGGNNRGKCVP